MDKIKFCGYNIAYLYDKHVKQWHNSLPKNSNYNRNKKRPLPDDINSGDSNQNISEIYNPPIPNHYKNVSKQQYMKDFDAAKHGPLHEQEWVIAELEAYDKARAKWTMKKCHRCKNGRIATARLKKELWWCNRCWAERRKVLENNGDVDSHIFLYSSENNMDPGPQCDFARGL
eukprot:373413_1